MGIQQTAEDSIVSVRVVASDEVANSTEGLRSLLEQVRAKPELILYGAQLHSSYVNPPALEAMHGHNTLVEVSLPYTLHVPTWKPLTVLRPYERGTAVVVTRKIWTELAAGSNEAEIYADDHLLYYAPAEPSIPFIPQTPELGPGPRFRGRNVEILKDTHGVFRYSRILVFFDTETPNIAATEENEEGQAVRSAAIAEATAEAKDIVNYVLDVYRYVTRSEHIERLSEMTVNRVYFAVHNLVSEGVSIPSGLTSAVVNRSRSELECIENMLSAGAEPDKHVLLLQSSRAALGRGQSVLAVVVAFQALEMLLEATLRVAFERQGLSEGEIITKLKENYRTKDRLTTLCREVTSGSSVADDTSFWSLWLTDCNGKRNRVVHKNESVTDFEAEKVVNLCEQCIARLLALPFPT